MRFTSKNPQETKKMAANIGRKINLKKTRSAFVIGLEGELGAGKTVFSKGLAKGLGVKAQISSPTFVIMKRYQGRSLVFYHLDAYRLKNYKELLPLGLKEVIKEPGNVVLIEWSDRVKGILPKKYLKVHIDHLSRNKRKISLTGWPAEIIT